MVVLHRSKASFCAVPGQPRPRVIAVDGNPSHAEVIAELKQERKLGRRSRWRTCRSFKCAWRTIQGSEVLRTIQKGEVRWLRNWVWLGRSLFVNEIFGLAAA